MFIASATELTTTQILYCIPVFHVHIIKTLMNNDHLSTKSSIWVSRVVVVHMFDCMYKYLNR